MKIRSGFVSNSSTSSFCLYGACVEEMDEILKKFAKKTGMEYSEEDFDPYEVSERFMEENFKDEEGDWVYESPPYDGDNAYVGRPWRDIGDDETGKQFKEKIEKAIERVFGKKVKCGTYEEAWHG